MSQVAPSNLIKSQMMVRYSHPAIHLLVPTILIFITVGSVLGYGTEGNEGEDLWGDTELSELTFQESDTPVGRSSRDNGGYSAKSGNLPLGLMAVFGRRQLKSTSSTPTATPTEESWPGKWFPSTSSKHRKKQLIETDSSGRVLMGVSSSYCDDGKTNLTMDWDMSPTDFTCFHPESRYPLESALEPKLECEDLPEKYMPIHFCMNQTIEYQDGIPTHGDHRPLWPKFGEYSFVPRQRWLHNIEHGAVVFLYHPCAHPMEVTRLKLLVKRCFGKHVITPSIHVPKDRPLALVAWGCRLLMSIVDDEAATTFIREKALHGPEGLYTKEGQYELGLIDFANKSGNAIYDRVTC